MSCSHVKTCELFVQFAMNPALDLWKQHYCNKSYIGCARFKMSSTGQAVPLTLLPNGKMVHAHRSSQEVAATTLFNAVLKSRTHMISVLIRAGVDPDVRNIEGRTPLMTAAELGAAEIARLLIENGADPNMVDETGETAYEIAMRKGHRHMANILRP